MGDKNVLFSVKFRGYDRKSVNTYIAETNRAFSEKETQMSEEIDRLRNENIKITDELQVVQHSVSEICSKIDTENADLEIKTRMVEKLSSELDELRSASEIEIRNKDNMIEMLKEQAVSDRVAYEAQIARIREECREKLTGHDVELDRIRDEYRAKEEEQYALVEAAAYRMRDRMAAELREVTKDCLREILHGIEEMKHGSDSMKQNVNDRYERMNKSIELYEVRMKAEVRRILDDFKNSGNSSGK